MCDWSIYKNVTFQIEPLLQNVKGTMTIQDAIFWWVVFWVFYFGVNIITYFIME